MVVQCEFLQSSYHTYIEENLDSFIVYFKEIFPFVQQVFVIIDQNVFLLQQERQREKHNSKNRQKSIFDILETSGIHYEIIIHEPGEIAKSLSTYSNIITAIEHSKIRPDRSTPILAFGGGVTGDLAGFVAATLLRGVPLVQIPTTLLSMVDSSVGAKVAVNSIVGKNRVGSFYPPHMVYVSLDVLSTLESKEWRCGIGEVLKYALLLDDAYWDLVEQFATSFDCQTSDRQVEKASFLKEIVLRSIAYKNDIVKKDPLEKSLRKSLNLGHSIGHVLERVALDTNIEITHGECVCFGVCWELQYMVEHQNCDPSLLVEFRKIAERFQMPTDESHLEWNTLCSKNLSLLALDKKNTHATRLTFEEDYGKVKQNNTESSDKESSNTVQRAKTVQKISLCCLQNKGNFHIKNIDIQDFILFFQRRMT